MTSNLTKQVSTFGFFAGVIVCAVPLMGHSDDASAPVQPEKSAVLKEKQQEAREVREPSAAEEIRRLRDRVARMRRELDFLEQEEAAHKASLDALRLKHEKARGADKEALAGDIANEQASAVRLSADVFTRKNALRRAERRHNHLKELESLAEQRAPLNAKLRELETERGAAAREKERAYRELVGWRAAVKLEEEPLENQDEAPKAKRHGNRNRDGQVPD